MTNTHITTLHRQKIANISVCYVVYSPHLNVSYFTFVVESHLASNVHKSRLVQQDLRVAKRLQEEEDLRAKAESKRQQRHL